MQHRREERAPERRARWRWIVGLVILAIGIWALYTFWYTPGLSRQATDSTTPAAESTH